MGVMRRALARTPASARGSYLFAHSARGACPKASRTFAQRGPRRVKVATDGEIGWVDMPLLFRVSPERLWLVRPEETAPELEAARE